MKLKNLFYFIVVLLLVIAIGCKVQVQDEGKEKEVKEDNLVISDESDIVIDDQKKPDSTEIEISPDANDKNTIIDDQDIEDIIEEKDKDPLLNESTDIDEEITDGDSSNVTQVDEGTVKISIKNLLFDPDNVKIKVGNTVIWTHNDNYRGFDNLRHKITIYNIGTSPILSYGDTYKYTFMKPGEYVFVDSIHTDMKGKIKVEE